MSEVPPPHPDALLDALREAAGPPPAQPLRIPEPIASDRRPPIGPLLTALRRGMMRLLTPALIELVSQLERDRSRVSAEVASLEDRIAKLESGEQD